MAPHLGSQLQLLPRLDGSGRQRHANHQQVKATDRHASNNMMTTITPFHCLVGQETNVNQELHWGTYPVMQFAKATAKRVGYGSATCVIALPVFGSTRPWPNLVWYWPVLEH